MIVYKLRSDAAGNHCIFADYKSMLEEMESLLDACDEDDITVSKFEMTQEEYDNLPEFQGW